MLRCYWAAVQNSWSTALHLGVVFIVSLFSLPGLFAVICHWLYLNVSVSTDVDFLHLALGHWLLFGDGCF